MEEIIGNIFYVDKNSINHLKFILLLSLDSFSDVSCCTQVFRINKCCVDAVNVLSKLLKSRKFDFKWHLHILGKYLILSLFCIEISGTKQTFSNSSSLISE